MQPLPDTAGVIRLFYENNTFFLGCLGNQSVVLCMCSVGASGRDSAQIVTGEALRFWGPSALIMVGIAFGRGSERQKIGDVLVSERIIAYEPQRVGSESTISRGQEFLPGTRLYHSFRNADMDWSFRDPNGLACAVHFGPMLSGEKLVDNPDFKSGLFEKHRSAIGGEMEGVGVATCAEREKNEWILVKLRLTRDTPFSQLYRPTRFPSYRISAVIGSYSSGVAQSSSRFGIRNTSITPPKTAYV